jgi:hypothetical protein
MRLRFALATIAVVSALSGSAHAGLLNKNIDFFFVDGTIGGEYEHLGLQPPTLGAPGGNGASDTWGVAYGAIAGFRIGKLSIGALFQRTDVLSGINGVNLDKVYAQVGLNLRISILIIVLHADIGWAGLEYANTINNGVGAKGGVAFDFYPIRILSIGFGADFDVQGYSLPSGFISSIGTTFGLRVGLHI